mgnify:FL=1
MGGTECSECLSFYVFYLACVRIIVLLGLPEEPVHAVADARSDVYVFQECEVRKSDLEVMRHSVLELVPESRLVEFGCLEVDPVLQRGVVSEGEFLVETLLAHSVLSLERIESAH